MTASPTVLLDCRWLQINGAGRLTELLLRSLARHPPGGRWILWGTEAVRPLAWPGAEVAITDVDPRAGFGQRSWFRIPDCDLAVFMHQQRPLRAVNSVTVVLDTIPLRFASNRLDRALKRRFLRHVVGISAEVVTISEYSRHCIGRDLGTDADKVTVLIPPADEDFGARVRGLRGRAGGEDVALYVGAFLPHKNLDRLVAAFARTRFAAEGGRLRLVGGAPDHLAELAGRLPADQARMVELRGRCPQSELDQLFATALFLVQPSLEEGFGLPVWEALSCDLPVCVSDGGSLPEITAGLAAPFPATCVESMTAAIDECAVRARRLRSDATLAAAERVTWGAPTGEQFSRRFEEVVWRNIALISDRR